MANDQRLMLLLEAQTRGYAAVIAFLASQISTLWRSFDKWYDGDLVAAQAARAATLTEGATLTVRQQTRSYLTYVYDQFQDLDFPTDEEIERLNDEMLDRIVNPLDEWNRPAEQYRFARSTGASDGEAIEIALNRADELADLDMELAMRGEARRIFQATPKITGYRRVLHPELADSKQSCGLCIAASTRVYNKKELLPIHDHCHCGVMPIVGDEDPGHTFNEADLKQLVELAGGNDAQALSRVRYKVNEHGELGPYLVEQGAKNRSVGKLAKPITRRESIVAQLNSLGESLPRLIERSRKGEDLTQPIEWQQDRIRILKSELGVIDRPKRRRR